MPTNRRLLAVGVTLAGALLIVLGVAFAAPGGTVILAPLAATQSGLPGTTVTHTLQITSSGGTAAITETFTLTFTGNQWPVTLPVTQVQLVGNASVTFSVGVTIPSTPTVTSDTVTLAVHPLSSSQVLTAQLTTQFFRVYLPSVSKVSPDLCQPTNETYGSLPVRDWEPSPPAETHPDLNLSMRGYTPTTAFLGLVDIGGAWDPAPPQLAGVFSPPRAPNIKATYQVYGWDWTCNCRTGPISPPEDPEVTLIDLAATPGETVHVPDRVDGEISQDGYKVLVLYASANRLTLKYTAEDNVIVGYTVHMESICVDPNLLALYQKLNNEGRHELPALRGGQALGRVPGNRVGVVIRDTGTFMDPRSRKDWWHGY